MKKIVLIIILILISLQIINAQHIDNGFFSTIQKSEIDNDSKKNIKQKKTTTKGIQNKNISTKEKSIDKTNSKQNSISLAVDLDPALFWSIAYSRLVSFKRNFKIQFKFKSYTFSYYDFNLNTNIFIFTNSSFNIISNIGLEMKHSKNTVHTLTALNGILGFMPGYFSKKWYMGTELLYKTGLVNYLTHSEYYKKIFSKVKDGWYYSDISYIYFSLNGGYKIMDLLETNLRAGIRITTEMKDYSPFLFPFFLNLTFTHRF